MKTEPIRINSQAGLDAMYHELKRLLGEFGEVSIDVVAGKRQKSSQSMKGTWRMWMKETAAWMANNGATMPLYFRPNGQPHGKRPFNEQDAHECFMRTWGGVDASGDRPHQEKVTKGEMLYIMDRHLAWAMEKGISLTIPNDGEYQQCKREEAA